MTPSAKAIFQQCSHYQNDHAFQDFLDDSGTDDDSDCTAWPTAMPSASTTSVSEGTQSSRVNRGPLLPSASSSAALMVESGKDCNSKSNAFTTDAEVYDTALGSAVMSAPIGSIVLSTGFGGESEFLGTESESLLRDCGSPQAKNSTVWNINGSNSVLQPRFQKDVETIGRCHHGVIINGEQGNICSVQEGSVKNPTIAFDDHSRADDVHLTVYTLGGIVATELWLPLSSTVREVKLQVWSAGGPCIANQVLMFGDEVMVDFLTLQDSGVSGKAELQVVCVVDEEDHDRIKTVFRCGPMSHAAAEGGHQLLCSVDRAAGEVTLRRAGEDEQSRTFAFDVVLDEACSECDVFDSFGLDLVDDFVAGYSCTALAYGTTASRKSFTLFGKGLDCPHEEQSLAPRSFNHLFERLESMPRMRAALRCTFIAIHNECIYDLLSEDSCEVQLKDDKAGHVYLKGASSRSVSTREDMGRVFTDGLCRRSALSSEQSCCPFRIPRANTIFTITMETYCKSNEACVRTLNMVELAGSERQFRAGSERLKDAAKLVLSLSALGNVISAIANGKSKFIPYRDSKLTRLLQDSLGGSAKTVFIGHIDPTNYDEALSTLRYTHRARNVKNKPSINVRSLAPHALESCDELETRYG